MSARTVEDRIAEARDLMRAAKSVLCAGCRHRYDEHDTFRVSGKCWHPRVQRDGEAKCKCKRFVDPTETLGVTEAAS